MYWGSSHVIWITFWKNREWRYEIWLADERWSIQNTRKRLITYSRSARRVVSARKLQEPDRSVDVRKKQARQSKWWPLASWPNETWVRVPVRIGVESWTTLKCVGVTVVCIMKKNWDWNRGASHHLLVDFRRHQRWTCTWWMRTILDLDGKNEKTKKARRRNHFAILCNQKPVDLKTSEKTDSVQ